MKYKYIAWMEACIILILAVFLISRFFTLTTRKPVVREPAAAMEFQIRYTPPPHPKPSLEDIERLAELKKKFTPRIVKITDTIYHAMGYALGNVQMIVTKEGLVVIDATESRSAASAIRAEFKKIADKPIKYLIYTHAHFDHVLGASVFKEPGTVVIATRTAVAELEQNFGVLGDFYNRCRQIQFGDVAEEFVRERPVPSPVKLPSRLERGDIVWPDITFETDYTFTLGEKTFHLYHTIGETKGHLMVWLPDEKALFCGDLYYESFPNLSSPMLAPRPVKQWYESLDRMVDLNAAFLIPGHTDAVIGAAAVKQTLVDRSRGIRSIYEQTLAYTMGNLNMFGFFRSAAALERQQAGIKP